MKDFWNTELDKLTSISTVIDVGVMEGTPDLYSRWTDSNIVLIDPLIESKSYVESCLANRNFKFFNLALGNEEKDITINIAKKLRESSILTRTTDNLIVEQRKVKMKTLDQLYNENINFFKPPFLLKIDTEGFELEVLKGSLNILKNTKYAILEVSIKKRFHNSYTFEDIILFMNENSFRVESILRAPKEITILDILFVNNDFE